MRKEAKEKDLQTTEPKKKRSFKSRLLIFFVNLFLVLVACIGLYVLFVFLQKKHYGS